MCAFCMCLPEMLGTKWLKATLLWSKLCSLLLSLWPRASWLASKMDAKHAETEHLQTVNIYISKKSSIILLQLIIENICNYCQRDINMLLAFFCQYRGYFFLGHLFYPAKLVTAITWSMMRFNLESAYKSFIYKLVSFLFLHSTAILLESA